MLIIPVEFSHAHSSQDVVRPVEITPPPVHGNVGDVAMVTGDEVLHRVGGHVRGRSWNDTSIYTLGGEREERRKEKRKTEEMEGTLRKMEEGLDCKMQAYK